MRAHEARSLELPAVRIGESMFHAGIGDHLERRLCGAHLGLERLQTDARHQRVFNPVEHCDSRRDLAPPRPVVAVQYCVERCDGAE